MLMIFILSACGGGSENLPAVVSYSKWDKPIQVSSVIKDAYTADDETPLISSSLHLYIVNDNLIIEDTESTDKIIHVIDIPSGLYIGSFGKFGDGPSEINNPGFVTSPEDGKLAVFDYGHWEIKAFDVDSALRYEDYSPRSLMSLSELRDADGFPDRFVHVHDGWGVARRIKINPEGRGYTESLCSFDLNTAAMAPFGVQDNPPRFHSSPAASYADSVVAEVSSNQDIIRLYDLNGNLKRTIKGPKYESQPSRGVHYYSKGVTGDGKLFAIYSGEESYLGKQIAVFSLDGKYLCSYQLPDLIHDMAYDRKRNRLYLALDGERQIVYLPLDEEMAPAGEEPQEPIAEAVESDEPKKEDNPDILTLIEPYVKETIPVETARYTPYKASESDLPSYFISVFNQTKTDTVRIDSVTADIECKIDLRIRKIIPNLMFSFTLTPDAPLESAKQDVKLTIHYDGDKRKDLPVVLVK